MPSGELLKNLFRSYAQGNADEFHAAALQLIAEEERLRHNVLAGELKTLLRNGGLKAGNTIHYHDLQRLPQDRERGAALVEVRTPAKLLPELILSSELASQIDQVLRESRSSALLKTYALKPANRLLFAGPPGCGKTLCADVIASELGLPLLYARFDSVISSYLGETAANLRKVFDFAQNGSWVVFFDEFDAIGKSRSNVEEHGELKRVVNTFLQLLDGFNSDNLVVAATNHEGLLDSALWRRFDDILYFDLPTHQQVVALMKLKLRVFPHARLEFDALARRMVRWPHSAVERVCLDAIKLSVLGGSDSLLPEALDAALTRQARRNATIKRSADQGD